MAVATGDGAGISTRRKICADEKHAWESPSAREQGTWRKKVVIDYKAIMQCSQDPCRLAHPAMHPSTQQHFTLATSKLRAPAIGFQLRYIQTHTCYHPLAALSACLFLSPHTTSPRPVQSHHPIPQAQADCQDTLQTVCNLARRAWELANAVSGITGTSLNTQRYLCRRYTTSLGCVVDR